MAKHIKVPFALSGDTTIIPDDTQPDGSVSFNEGYSPDYAADQTADPNAKDIPRQAENYLRFIITNALKELQERGFRVYTNDVDYPSKSYTVGSDGLAYVSTAINGPGSVIVDPVGDLTGVWVRWGFNEAQVRAQPTAVSASVYFNGVGVVAIVKAFNVSSVTDLGVGAYAVNFDTPMPDEYYTVVGGSSIDAGGQSVMVGLNKVTPSKTINSVNIITAVSTTGTAVDAADILINVVAM